MQKPLLTILLVALALLNLSTSEEKGSRKIACDVCQLSGNPMPALSLSKFPIQPSMLSALQSLPGSASLSHENLLQAQTYANMYMDASTNYLTMLGMARMNNGITSPLFSVPAPMVLSEFKPVSFATTATWAGKQLGLKSAF